MSSFVSMRQIAFLIAVAVLSPIAVADDSQSELLRKAIDTVFKPSTEALATQTEKLHQTLLDGCEQAAVDGQFRRTVEAFSTLEYYRLGVINQKHRAERLFFWPDRKGRGRKQVRRLMADPKTETLALDQLAKKSVAVQGLPALELILYATDEISENNCRLAQLISENMHVIAKEAAADWTSELGIATQLLRGGADSLYRTPTEAIAALLTLSENALLTFADRKLALLIKGLQNTEALPKSLPFARSELAFLHLRDNFLGIKALLISSGIAAHTDAESMLSFEFDTGLDMLEAAETALDKNDPQTAADRIIALQFIAHSIKTKVLEDVAPVLGVVTGFNSNDGD